MRSRLVSEESASEYRMPKGVVDAFIIRVSEPMGVRSRSVLGCPGASLFNTHTFTCASQSSHLTVPSLCAKFCLRPRRRRQSWRF